MNKFFTIIFVVLLLLLSLFLSPVSGEKAVEITSGNTIYVDDDNIDGPWDGSQEHPYQEIQDGIDGAGEGDTIFVFEGKYSEIYIFDKILNIVGQNKYKTIIENDDSINDMCYFTNSSILLCNFSIRNAFEYGINIIDGKNNYIKNNIIISNGIGISIFSSENNIIENNIIEDNKNIGIIVSWSKSNSIKNNEINNTKNGDGLIIDYSIDNTIEKNIFINNHQAIKIRNEIPRMPYTKRNMIINNNLINNEIYANCEFDVSFLFTKFSHNYWGKPRILPKIIRDSNSMFPFPANIDFFPAKEPHMI